MRPYREAFHLGASDSLREKLVRRGEDDENRADLTEVTAWLNLNSSNNTKTIIDLLLRNCYISSELADGRGTHVLFRKMKRREQSDCV